MLIYYRFEETVRVTVNQIRLGSVFVDHEYRIYQGNYELTSDSQQDLVMRSVWSCLAVHIQQQAHMVCMHIIVTKPQTIMYDIAFHIAFLPP